jgi:hypothetical protein
MHMNWISIGFMSMNVITLRVYISSYSYNNDDWSAGNTHTHVYAHRMVNMENFTDNYRIGFHREMQNYWSCQIRTVPCWYIQRIQQRTSEDTRWNHWSTTLSIERALSMLHVRTNKDIYINRWYIYLHGMISLTITINISIGHIDRLMINNEILLRSFRRRLFTNERFDSFYVQQLITRFVEYCLVWSL